LLFILIEQEQLVACFAFVDLHFSLSASRSLPTGTEFVSTVCARTPIVTSQLHAYLPTVNVGTVHPVDSFFRIAFLQETAMKEESMSNSSVD
jgi:hypothetical protein